MRESLKKQILRYAQDDNDRRAQDDKDSVSNFGDGALGVC